MTRYASGRRKEYAVVRMLREAGWEAQRSAGSHGLWDVVAVKRGQRPRFIQVKYTKVGNHLLAYPPAVVVDKNARALLALEGADETPIDAELWVFYRGDSVPTMYAPYNGVWGYDASVWVK